MPETSWIPAFAGMTVRRIGNVRQGLRVRRQGRPPAITAAPSPVITTPSLTPRRHPPLPPCHSRRAVTSHYRPVIHAAPPPAIPAPSLTPPSPRPRHSRESGNPRPIAIGNNPLPETSWIPAFAGMTVRRIGNVRQGRRVRWQGHPPSSPPRRPPPLPPSHPIPVIPNAASRPRHSQRRIPSPPFPTPHPVPAIPNAASRPRHSRRAIPVTHAAVTPAPSFPRKRESRTFPAMDYSRWQWAVDSRFRGNDGGADSQCKARPPGTTARPPGMTVRRRREWRQAAFAGLANLPDNPPQHHSRPPDSVRGFDDRD